MRLVAAQHAISSAYWPRLVQRVLGLGMLVQNVREPCRTRADYEKEDYVAETDPYLSRSAWKIVVDKV